MPDLRITVCWFFTALQIFYFVILLVCMNIDFVFLCLLYQESSGENDREIFV